LVDAQTGAELGVMHRYSELRAHYSDQRLMIDVMESVKSETDNLNPQWLSAFAMFGFKPGTSLSFWRQGVSATRYVLEGDRGFFMVCNKRPPALAKPRP
jgi:hypothetical protein